MPDACSASYATWLAEFARRAQALELGWLVDPSSPELRAAFEQGRSPQDELDALSPMCEWRGCGCGAGS